MSDTPTITGREDGPLIAKGIAKMLDDDGNEMDVRPAMGLCRCGKSANKPFCDGAHNDAGFCSDGNAETQELGASPEVELLKDGPMKVSAEGEKPLFLCRCGLSKNKPFCDGSHNKEGWTSG